MKLVAAAGLLPFPVSWNRRCAPLLHALFAGLGLGCTTVDVRWRIILSPPDSSSSMMGLDSVTNRNTLDTGASRRRPRLISERGEQPLLTSGESTLTEALFILGALTEKAKSASGSGTFPFLSKLKARVRHRTSSSSNGGIYAITRRAAGTIGIRNALHSCLLLFVFLSQARARTTLRHKKSSDATCSYRACCTRDRKPNDATD
jgi:hypothetical protein